MNGNKKFKDPIYGYINIEKDLIDNVIDTSNFQRLRNVTQTSYAPLYASAVHNRFVHSLGVYHLGKILVDNVELSLSNYSQLGDIKRYLKIFKIACLLHDVGHAPFSHTGEKFYLEDGDRTNLHNEICALIDDENLKNEIINRNYKAAPHELMSVIVSLKEYEYLFTNKEEKDLFARCILGYPYEIEKDDLKHSFFNCLISFLNSSVIDVDKLDYLIRDSYIIGFDTISIDYERLLENVRIEKIRNKFEVLYTKGAISVIENVVYAHDSERKWIQNHPVVQYEIYLFNRLMEQISSEFLNVFSYKSLTTDGLKVKEDLNVSLIGDGDVLFLMKNLKNKKYINEYYSRNTRMHPLWKSESEYKAIFGVNGDTVINSMEVELNDLCNYISKINGSGIIDDNILKEINEDINDTQIFMESVGNENVKGALDDKKRHMEWIKIFKEFSEEENIKFEFLILWADQFNSGFSKDDLGNIKIKFKEFSEPCFFKSVTNVLKADKSDRKNFFYIFYRRENMSDSIDVNKFACKMSTLATKYAFEKRVF